MTDFTDWKDAAKAELPDIANRVFALRGRRYLGYGFHYAMEVQLGRWIMRLCSSNPLNLLTEDRAKAVRLTWPVLWDEFKEGLTRAEHDLKEAPYG